MAKRLSRRPRAHRLVGTWPRRIGALFGSALAAWAVATFVPALLHETTTRVGLAKGPVNVAVITDPDRIPRAGPLEHIPMFVIQRPIDQIGPPPDGDDFRGRYSWAHAMGGIDAGETIVRLVIRGRTDAPVVLDGMRVRIVERRPVVHGTLLSYFGLGAGQPVRYFDVRLDPSPPTIKYVGDNAETKTFFPYQVSRTDVEVFDLLVGLIRPEDVSWRLLLDYSADGADGTMTIDDHGKPFRTTAEADITVWKDLLHKKGPPAQVGYGWLRGKWVMFRQV